MLRGENVVCGTSTTGTGTLTLAATPAAIGAIDPFVWLTNWYSSGSLPTHLIPYQLIEYTDSTFSVPKQTEIGVGTVTLGANLGATTFARTTVLATEVIGTPAYSAGSPSAISIGTAANTLLFIAPSASLVPQCCPYVDTADASDGINFGIGPANVNRNSASVSLTSGQDLYWPFEWRTPLLVKRASLRVATAYSGGTSNAYFRIYEIGTNGRPGRLLIDFGLLGTSNASLNSAANIQSALAATGVFLTPGEYIADVYCSYTGGTGTPQLQGFNAGAGGIGLTGRFGTFNLLPIPLATASSGNATAPDPANTTSFGVSTANPFAFSLWNA